MLNLVATVKTFLSFSVRGGGGRRKNRKFHFFNLSLTNCKVIAWAPLLTNLHLCIYMFTCVSTFPGCSAGYATLFSRLCYPVQQAMLPCSAGYATLFSRLCFPVQQAMLPCSVGYAKQM